MLCRDHCPPGEDEALPASQIQGPLTPEVTVPLRPQGASKALTASSCRTLGHQKKLGSVVSCRVSSFLA